MTEIMTTGCRPYFYVGCECGYTGSTVCEREVAEADRLAHRRWHRQRAAQFQRKAA